MTFRDKADLSLIEMGHDQRQQLARIGFAKRDAKGEWRFTDKGLKALREAGIRP